MRAEGVSGPPGGALGHGLTPAPRADSAAPELRPWECTAGPGRCRTSRRRGARAGRGARAARAAPLLPVPCPPPPSPLRRAPLQPQLQLPPSLPPVALLNRPPLHPSQVPRLTVGRRGGEAFRSDRPQEEPDYSAWLSWKYPSWNLTALCGQRLGEVPPSLGLGFPLWRRLWNGLVPSPL